MVNLHKNSGQKFKSQEEKTMENSISIPENNTNVNSNSTKKVSLLKKIKCLGYNILLHKKLEPFLILNKLSKDVYNPYFDIDYKVSNMWCSYEKLKYNLNFRKKLLKSDNELKKVQEKYGNDNLSLIFQLLHAVTVVIELFCTTNYSSPYTDGKYHTPSDYHNWDTRKNKGWSFFLPRYGSNPTILLMEQRILFRILACENVNEYFEMINNFKTKNKWGDMLSLEEYNGQIENRLYGLYFITNMSIDFKNIHNLSLEDKYYLLHLEVLKRGYFIKNHLEYIPPELIKLYKLLSFKNKKEQEKYINNNFDLFDDVILFLFKAKIINNKIKNNNIYSYVENIPIEIQYKIKSTLDVDINNSDIDKYISIINIKTNTNNKNIMINKILNDIDNQLTSYYILYNTKLDKYIIITIKKYVLKIFILKEQQHIISYLDNKIKGNINILSINNNSQNIERFFDKYYTLQNIEVQNTNLKNNKLSSFPNLNYYEIIKSHSI